MNREDFEIVLMDENCGIFVMKCKKHEFIEAPDPDNVFTKWICKNCKSVRSDVID